MSNDQSDGLRHRAAIAEQNEKRCLAMIATLEAENVRLRDAIKHLLDGDNGSAIAALDDADEVRHGT